MSLKICKSENKILFIFINYALAGPDIKDEARFGQRIYSHDLATGLLKYIIYSFPVFFGGHILYLNELVNEFNSII